MGKKIRTFGDTEVKKQISSSQNSTSAYVKKL